MWLAFAAQIIFFAQQRVGSANTVCALILAARARFHWRIAQVPEVASPATVGSVEAAPWTALFFMMS
ncbi:hypothetical protein EON67_09460 [archaeon]|nr:MAG: hypothetical protein EON67_09460 [archaeon]